MSRYWARGKFGEARVKDGRGGENGSKLSHELIVKLDIRVSQKLAKLGAGGCP